MILTHSSNGADSAHRASHRRQSTHKLRGNNMGYLLNPSAGAVRLDDYRFSGNETNSPHGPDSVLLPDDGGSLKQVVSMKQGVLVEH